MNAGSDERLSDDLRRLSPRELSAGLEAHILRLVETPEAVGAPQTYRSLPPAAAAVIAFATMAAAVAALAIWLPRQPPKPAEVARQESPANVKTPFVGSRGGESPKSRAAVEEDNRRSIDFVQRTDQEEIKHGQSGDRTAQAHGQVGQASAHVGEKAQSGAKLGGFQSDGGAARADNRESGASETESAWQRVAQGRMVDVDAQRVLYEQPGEKRFFVRVRITNKTDRALGVELSDSSVVYPNQWGVHPADHRMDINERRIEFANLSDEKKAELTRAFAAKKLFDIRPKQSLMFVRAFKGKNCREESAAETGFLIISLDGRLLVTDGREVDDVRCSWLADGSNSSSDLVIPCPVVWKRVPRMEILVGDD